ncbi:acetyl-CoA synthetase [Mycolicibacterium duvalii]|uniref:AMP-dependent synthetase/ligase domain-containing protein n=1 Tax=Mycolicibacterium duvalii TaxID=39688 RepID=A0A7I7K334_9MYCO|nr:AMP-binding protein [Mycolicibacterium duvalii]MCV7367934.1 AMP-binding protein [Mycolicibacterium duvalii]PEG39059.1 acetyl-CoA synthetase [Mycolicibacterium duvalii]BBX18475.1 hypothetical protein MDUV_33350 [Mycolicibacterium duvalii]
MTVIRKTAEDWRVPPNFVDYEKTRADFDWSAVPDVCTGMGSGLCNIAYAAVDRHAEGPAASRTALRFVSASDWDGGQTIRDLSYAELGRLVARFTGVLRALGVHKGGRVYTLLGRSPELYVSILGALRNGSVVTPLFSAFGPEPIATRLNLGEAEVLITTRALYRKKVAGIRDTVPTLRHVLIVDDHGGESAGPGTINFWQWMDAATDGASIEPTTADDPALLHFTSGTTGTPKGAHSSTTLPRTPKPSVPPISRAPRYAGPVRMSR